MAVASGGICPGPRALHARLISRIDLSGSPGTINLASAMPNESVQQRLDADDAYFVARRGKFQFHLGIAAAGLDVTLRAVSVQVRFRSGFQGTVFIRWVDQLARLLRLGGQGRLRFEDAEVFQLPVPDRRGSFAPGLSVPGRS